MKKNKKNKNFVPDSEANPVVQPDESTETGVPIPSEYNVENAKEYGEENEL